MLVDLHTPWITWGNLVFGTNHQHFTHWDAPVEWWGKAAYDFLKPEIYDSLKPYPMVKLAVDRLRSRGHRISFVSSCHTPEAAEAKKRWLLRHDIGRALDGFYSQTDKSNAPVDVLVDDGLHNCETFAGRAVLVTRPHNLDHPWHGSRISSVVDLLHLFPAASS